MPVTGISPIFMPTFSSVWISSMPKMPIAISRPSESRARLATVTACHKTRQMNESIVVAPTKPSSSAVTAKMKSVYCTGKKLRWLCVPLSRPSPSMPPLPTATLDASTL